MRSGQPLTRPCPQMSGAGWEFLRDVLPPEACFHTGQTSAALVLAARIRTSWSFQILFGRGLTLKQWDLG